MLNKSEFKDRLQNLNKELGASVLVAVTKYSEYEDIRMAFECGVRNFGENRVQDLNQKSQTAKNEGLDILWHFIGGLQSNKVKDLLAVDNLSFIHSVDSLKLIKEFVKRKASFKGRELNLFLQVNTSGESEKGGFNDFESLKEAIKFGREYLFDDRIKFIGLMTMGKIRTEDFEREARGSFKKLKEIKLRLENDLKLDSLKLSMGMSKDYEIALEEGADFVRVGSILFKD